MIEESLRIRAVEEPASVILGRADGLSAGSLALADDAMTAGTYLETVLRTKRYEDAIRFMATALPPRQGVWWVASCVGDVFPVDQLADDLHTVLDLTIRWCVRPDAGLARRAREAGRLAENAVAPHPITLLAEVLPAAVSNVGRPLAGIVLWSATFAEEPGLLVSYRRILQRGLLVSRGEALWQGADEERKQYPARIQD